MMTSAFVMEGALNKWTNMVKGWQYRWFVLDTCAGLLSYYTSKEKMIKGDRRGCVRLKGAVIGIDEEDKNTFSITVDGKTFRFQAHDFEERSKWVSSLEDTILRHTYTRRKLRRLYTANADQQSSSSSYAATGTAGPSTAGVGFKLPTLADYERKLAETDAYLQLLIGQTRGLDGKISASTSNYERDRLVDIKAKTLTLLDSIKHTIFLLQIAKNSAFPAAAAADQSSAGRGDRKIIISGGDSSASCYSSLSSSSRPVSEPIFAGGEAVARPHREGEQEKQEEEEANPDRRKTHQAAFIPNIESSSSPSNGPTTSATCVVDGPDGPPHRKESKVTLPITVPEVSYSSDDDEDFYDAIEDTPSLGRHDDDDDDDEDGGGHSSSRTIFRSQGSTESSDRVFLSARSPSPADTITENSSATTTDLLTARSSMDSTGLTDRSIMALNDDYDRIYEDSDEDELPSMEAHGSVISHLLSQVKIGMDLTKVVLPTFILERRSLLEMYADFFAHPDLFISIPDQPSAELRMIQVLKWYLSAFHAGRKSTVAKKPYNPILGELFKCYWEIPNYDPKGSNDDTAAPAPAAAAEGPIQWARPADLTFVAEQVSHHPPVSAFYAEHVEKRIQCVTHIYTKSKFLGLSVGVHNMGAGTIRLLDHGEDYVITFPSAYGRSILSVPWIELGGSCSIACPQTGYTANIEFQTKPFYGGKKNRVTAELLHPGRNNKAPICSIHGEWNGTMYIKYPMSDPSSQAREAVFVDTKTMPIIKKVVKPIREQQSFESRRIWKEVTRALKSQDVVRATQEKSILEQRQRELVKSRASQNLKWENRLFHLVGEKWFYNKPLSSRIVTRQ